MAKRIRLSSEEEQKIEKAYLNTATGKTMFTLTLVACVALIIGLLIQTYKMSNPGVDYSQFAETLFMYSEQLYIWGSVVALIGLVFYIKFARDFRNSNSQKKVSTNKKKIVKKITKEEKKTVAKSPAIKKAPTQKNKKK